MQKQMAIISQLKLVLYVAKNYSQNLIYLSLARWCHVISKAFAPIFWIVIVSYVSFYFVLPQVDGDTSTNDTVIALASGLSGLACISSLDSDEAIQLQACLDAVKFTLYSFITIFSSNIFILFLWTS